MPTNPQQKSKPTGDSVGYYSVHITNPTTKNRLAYTAECNDIIEALGMNYAQGNAFKAIWRSCAAVNLGMAKEDYSGAVYDSEKVIFFARRMLMQATENKSFIEQLSKGE